MIDPRAEPIAHRSPYKRIETGCRLPWRQRKALITRYEIEDNLEPVPDPAFYDYDPSCDVWRLRQ